MTDKTSDNKEVPVIFFNAEYTAVKIYGPTNLTPAFQFTYKPLNVFQAAQLTDAVIDAGKYEKVMVANLLLISRHIVDWDLTKPDGASVDFANIEELKLLSPRIIDLVLQEIRKDKSTPKQDQELAESVGN